MAGVFVNNLVEAIEKAAHLLPAQGPITVFVHHNTLHALEHLPFEQAVIQAADLYGCRPYMEQGLYQRELSKGRIQPADIEACLLERLGDDAGQLVGVLGTRYSLRRAILMHPFQAVLPNELDWVIAESLALDRFSTGVSTQEVQRLISATRRWVTRLLQSNSTAGQQTARPSRSDGIDMNATNGSLENWEADRMLVLLNSLDRSYATDRMHKWDDGKWSSFTLQLLWALCLQGVSQHPDSCDFRPPRRHRDFLHSKAGFDCDQLVHEFLIRFCLVMLDQGLSRWQIPLRNMGIFTAFVLLYAGQSSWLCERWLRPLAGELKRIHARGLSPLESIEESLQMLGVCGQEREPFIAQSLLALRGFAGMIWQMEKRRDRIAHPLPNGSLIEFLAVRLVLERLALQFVATEYLGWDRSLSELRDRPYFPDMRHSVANVRCEAFTVFQLAQELGWHPESLWNLTPANWRLLLDEIRSFGERERLVTYHLAYERRYRQRLLDSLRLHVQNLPSNKVTNNDTCATSFDLVTCIDEREESLRRHLEELSPRCRTWGAAGFFSVAMYYRSAESHQFLPLCPIVIEPQHYVQEVVTLDQAQSEQRRSALRKQMGAVLLAVHARSRMLTSGALTALLGALAAFPLVARVLFPRLTGLFRHRFDQLVSAPTQTVLQLERSDAVSDASLLEAGNDSHLHIGQEQTSAQRASVPQVGYTLDEMSAVVERLLRDIGMTSHWSRLVVVLGHGSSTMNNPHESAYDCGACGGGRGGPNARAFAQMANDPRVRHLLTKRGLHIPPSTHFVGGFHNTCNDQLILYDLARVPASHSNDVTLAQRALYQACERNAHERCRRFESADLNLTPKAALRHVRARSEDLSQVRPECGHATNAACIVGRRKWTRGLFLDRRAFLHSYDPSQDDSDNTLLSRILAAVIPVCAGINLEYYFSHVDPEGYGCGTKLPHNIASLVGVMNGAASDLRPGLPWQMVEIHEPMRLLVVVETTPEVIQQIMNKNAEIRRLVRGGWIQLSTIQPETGSIQRFCNDIFVPHPPESTELSRTRDSISWYRGKRENLDFAQLVGLQQSNASTHWNPT